MLLTRREIVPFSLRMTTVPTNLSVPLTFSRSHKGCAPGHSPSQFYDVVPYAPSGGPQAQALLRDRLVASPRIDLNDYSAKAVIDWVKLKAQTPGYHQAINMQRRLAEILKDGGESSSVFVGGPDLSEAVSISTIIESWHEREDFRRKCPSIHHSPIINLFAEIMN